MSNTVPFPRLSSLSQRPLTDTQIHFFTGLGLYFFLSKALACGDINQAPEEFMHEVTSPLN